MQCTVSLNLFEHLVYSNVMLIWVGNVISKWTLVDNFDFLTNNERSCMCLDGIVKGGIS